MLKVETLEIRLRALKSLVAIKTIDKNLKFIFIASVIDLISDYPISFIFHCCILQISTYESEMKSKFRDFRSHSYF